MAGKRRVPKLPRDPSKPKIRAVGANALKPADTSAAVARATTAKRAPGRHR